LFTLQKSAFSRADFAPDPDANEAEQLAVFKAFIADKEASLFNTLDAQAVRDEVVLKCGFQLDLQLTPIAEVTLAGAQSLALPTVDLLALDPFQQRLGHTADLGRNRFNSRPQRGIFASVLLHQPHRTLPDFGGKLVYLVHGSTFSKVGASSVPGAAHPPHVLVSAKVLLQSRRAKGGFSFSSYF